MEASNNAGNGGHGSQQSSIWLIVNCLADSNKVIRFSQIDTVGGKNCCGNGSSRTQEVRPMQCGGKGVSVEFK